MATTPQCHPDGSIDFDPLIDLLEREGHELLVVDADEGGRYAVLESSIDTPDLYTATLQYVLSPTEGGGVLAEVGDHSSQSFFPPADDLPDRLRDWLYQVWCRPGVHSVRPNPA